MKTLRPLTATVLVANNTAPLDGIANLEIHCSRGVAARVGLDAGANAQGNARRMIAGSNYLNYELYTTPARGTVWGTGAQAITLPTSTGPADPRLAHVVYGRIPAGQNVAPGDYNDTVTATITF